MEKVISLSTDKAVSQLICMERPSYVDKLFISQIILKEKENFSVVRYGNVMGVGAQFYLSF